MTEQEQEIYELPSFSLTFEGKTYDLFTSLSDSNVLLFGEDYVPQTIEIPISSDEEQYSLVLYDSAIIYMVLELKSMLGIVNTDVVVKLPQLELDIHEDISVLKKLTCNDVYQYWVKLAHFQGISESEIEPLQIVLQKHNNCIKDRITFLHYLGERGSDIANPILVEDSEVELHYSDDSVDSVDDLTGEHENDVDVVDVVERDQLDDLEIEQNEFEDLIYDDGETLASGTDSQKVNPEIVADQNEEIETGKDIENDLALIQDEGTEAENIELGAGNQNEVADAELSAETNAIQQQNLGFDSVTEKTAIDSGSIEKRELELSAAEGNS
ncbi:hypothetical protein HDV01_000115 [Terramyces sp. JEL0728]|nr:hypothetical protein HDV01_000115 [Terramyces sp. JEL0728]